jgi:3,4-dihydroxy 2-butanone 4-phosphate synthase / GTP cyclohydrolase II
MRAVASSTDHAASRDGKGHGLSLADKRPRGFASVEEALAAVACGHPIVVVDDHSCTPEGAVIVAAERVTPAAVNFMASHARGLICVALTRDRCDELDLEMMPRPPAHGQAPGFNFSAPAFTVSVEARQGISTGISAADRAHTIRVAIDPDQGPGSLVRPGHVFPIRTCPGGVVERRGHAESAVDLARLADLAPGAALSKILNADGTMADIGDLLGYCRLHRMPLLRISDLAASRHQPDTRRAS